MWVLEKFRSSGWEGVLEEIVNHLRPKGSIRRTPQGIWPRYCRTILSSAMFFSQFGSAEDFYEWIDLGYKQPILIRPKESDGFSFAGFGDASDEEGIADVTPSSPPTRTR